jgi:ABC-type amino acid transport substrate-binding protein
VLKAKPEFKDKLIPFQKTFTFEELLTNRANGLLIDLGSGIYRMVQRNMEGQVMVHPDFKIFSAPVHFMFSKASVSVELVDAFNEVITQQQQAQ